MTNSNNPGLKIEDLEDQIQSSKLLLATYQIDKAIQSVFHILSRKRLTLTSHSFSRIRAHAQISISSYTIQKIGIIDRILYRQNYLLLSQTFLILKCQSACVKEEGSANGCWSKRRVVGSKKKGVTRVEIQNKVQLLRMKIQSLVAVLEEIGM